MSHRLSDAFQSTQGADRSQDMRRIRALLAAGLDPATFTAEVQQLIEEAAFCSVGQQPFPKFREDREVKPRVGQLQA